MGNCFSIKKVTPNVEANQTYATPYIPIEIGKELGGVEEREINTYSKTLLQKYIIQEGIASGLHWSAVKCVRKLDRKNMIIKRINKDKLPMAEQYFPACISSSSCSCTRCKPDIIQRPPLELILLQSKDNGLPELVEYCEDESDYYLITKTHGISERDWRRIWTWFGSRRFSRVYWHEYFS